MTNHSTHTGRIKSSKDPVVSLQSVSKKYRLGDQILFALRDINLDIHRGEFVSIIGPSGSGKSTFLYMASVLDRPSEGQVYINGTETAAYSEAERAVLRNREIGFIFQQFNLLPKTSAIDNVALPLIYANVKRNERQRRAVEMLQKVGLGDRLQNTPAQLSGGQQQRVAIARALINNPSVIYADEPTGNLDSQTGEEIKQMLADLNAEGRTVVIVTHEKPLAAIARRRIALKDGQVITDET